MPPSKNLANNELTSQVVFLIDAGLMKQENGNRLCSSVKFACLKILSYFNQSQHYRNVRWSYKFYTLNSLPKNSSHNIWKDFNLEEFEHFEEKLDLEWERERGVVPHTPKSRRSIPAVINTDIEPYREYKPITRYSHSLYSTLTDFEWDAPEFSSPVKLSSSRVSRTTVNHVINFTTLPTSRVDYRLFTGSESLTARSLVKLLLSNDASNKWKNEKKLHLTVVHVENEGGQSPETELWNVYSEALNKLKGNLLKLNDLISTQSHGANLMLSSIFSKYTKTTPSTLVPSNTLLEHHLLHKLPHSSSVTQVKSEITEQISVKLDDKLIYQLHPISSTDCDHTDLSSTLYIKYKLYKYLVNITWTDSDFTVLCKISSDNSINSLISLSHQCLILSCEEDLNCWYLLQVITSNIVNITKIKLDHIQTLLHICTDSNTDAKVRALPSRPDHMFIKPHKLVTKKEKSAILHDLREKYRKERSTRLTSTDSKQADSALIQREPVKPQKSNTSFTRRKSNKVHLHRGSVALEKSEQLKSVKRSSGEHNLSNQSDNSNKTHTDDLNNKKKIILTQISLLDLSDERELISHVNKSYEEAVLGSSCLLLCGQSIINTVLCYYKSRSMGITEVILFVRSNLIKSSSDIKKNCLRNTQRKELECKLHVLLLLELEATRFQCVGDESSSDNKQTLVDNIYSYLVIMSLGRPQIIHSFFSDVITPSYGLQLKSLLIDLYNLTGQELPQVLRGSPSPYKPVYSVLSTESQADTQDMMSCGTYSVCSEDSQMSQSMLGSRSLLARSFSDVSSRRSISVPRGLVKNKNRTTGKIKSGISSRTRSKTPNKQQQENRFDGLTEFPKGFLNELNQSASQPTSVPSFDQSPGLRRSPRIALQQSYSQDCIRGRVKRDLFSSPTTKPTSLSRTHSHQQNPDASAGVLVPETPQFKRSRKSLQTCFSQPLLSSTEINLNNHDITVEESPLKLCERSAVMKPEERMSYTNITFNHSLPVSRLLNRRKSFYDVDKKSRNVGKMEALEKKMRCALGTNKCTPRRITAHILKEALHQNHRQSDVFKTKLEPQAESALCKSDAKKQLFMSPQRTPQFNRTSFSGLIPTSGSQEEQTISTDPVKSPADVLVQETPVKSDHVEVLPQNTTPHKTSNPTLTPHKTLPYQIITQRKTSPRHTTTPRKNSPHHTTTPRKNSPHHVITPLTISPCRVTLCSILPHHVIPSVNSSSKLNGQNTISPPQMTSPRNLIQAPNNTASLKRTPLMRKRRNSSLDGQLSLEEVNMSIVKSPHSKRPKLNSSHPPQPFSSLIQNDQIDNTNSSPNSTTQTPHSKTSHHHNAVTPRTVLQSHATRSSNKYSPLTTADLGELLNNPLKYTPPVTTQNSMTKELNA